jgi:hypothetical protein
VPAIFTEHFLEHLDEADGLRLRCFAYYGRMPRVSLVNRIMLGEALSGLKYASGGVSHSEGHRHYYTVNSLWERLQEVGFTNVETRESKHSPCPLLHGVDTRLPLADVIFEGTKPGAKDPEN